MVSLAGFGIRVILASQNDLGRVFFGKILRMGVNPLNARSRRSGHLISGYFGRFLITNSISLLFTDFPFLLQSVLVVDMLL